MTTVCGKPPQFDRCKTRICAQICAADRGVFFPYHSMNAIHIHDSRFVIRECVRSSSADGHQSRVKFCLPRIHEWLRSCQQRKNAAEVTLHFFVPAGGRFVFRRRLCGISMWNLRLLCTTVMRLLSKRPRPCRMCWTLIVAIEIPSIHRCKAAVTLSAIRAPVR